MQTDTVELLLYSIFLENQLVRRRNGVPILHGEDVVDVIRTFSHRHFNGVSLLLDEEENSWSGQVASTSIIEVTPKDLAPILTALVKNKLSRSPTPIQECPPVGSFAVGTLGTCYKAPTTSDKLVRSQLANLRTGGTSTYRLQGLLDHRENDLDQLCRDSDELRRELRKMKIENIQSGSQLVRNAFCS